MLTKCMIELSFAKNIDLVSSPFLCPENSARSAMVRGCCRFPALKLISSCGKTKSVPHGCPLFACVVSLSWSPIRFFLSWREIQDHEPSCNVIWTYQTRTSTWNLCHPEFFHVFETSNSVLPNNFRPIRLSKFKLVTCHLFYLPVRPTQTVCRGLQRCVENVITASRSTGVDHASSD